MTSNSKSLGASFGEIFMSGVRGYLANLVPLTLAGMATLAVYAAFRIPAQRAFDGGDVWQSLAIDLVGLLLASIVAYPWYALALGATDGKPVDLGLLLRDGVNIRSQAVASIWFWAAVLLGLRYFLGIPAMLAAVFYAFYGFAIADGRATGGLAALGYSVRLGDGRRIGIGAFALVMMLFTMLGAFAIGFDVNTATMILAVAGLVVTTNVTLVAGAKLYRLLQQDLVNTETGRGS